MRVVFDAAASQAPKLYRLIGVLGKSFAQRLESIGVNRKITTIRPQNNLSSTTRSKGKQYVRSAIATSIHSHNKNP
jgi:hypothetical protein